MATTIEWHNLSSNDCGDVSIAKVPGGWLLKEYQNVSHHTPERGMVDGYDWRTAMVFIPDPKHELPYTWAE